jgi:putative endonuclease
MTTSNKNAWVVYILKCADDSFYTGITNDITARITAHKNGTGAKYTKGRSPLTLVYLEECENRSTATKREIGIKRLRKIDKEKLIAQTKIKRP